MPTKSYICDMLTAMIIDDQQQCIDDLSALIKLYCSNITIIGSALSGKDGIEQLSIKKPQLIFLDVEMQDMTGFDMLQQMGDIQFQIIFTTSFDKYAIQAIRFNAFDYLLKPVRKDELTAAVERIASAPPASPQQINQLKETQQKVPLNKIALTTSDGLEYVKLEDIIYCLAEGSYTTVFLIDGSQLLVSKSIGKLDDLIDGNGFYRTHNSSLVNLSHVKKFVKTDGGYLVMSNGDTVTVARNRKEEFLELFSKF